MWHFAVKLEKPAHVATSVNEWTLLVGLALVAMPQNRDDLPRESGTPTSGGPTNATTRPEVRLSLSFLPPPDRVATAHWVHRRFETE